MGARSSSATQCLCECAPTGASFFSVRGVGLVPKNGDVESIQDTSTLYDIGEAFELSPVVPILCVSMAYADALYDHLARQQETTIDQLLRHQQHPCNQLDASEAYAEFSLHPYVWPRVRLSCVFPTTEDGINACFLPLACFLRTSLQRQSFVEQTKVILKALWTHWLPKLEQACGVSISIQSARHATKWLLQPDMERNEIEHVLHRFRHAGYAVPPYTSCLFGSFEFDSDMFMTVALQTTPEQQSNHKPFGSSCPAASLPLACNDDRSQKEKASQQDKAEEHRRQRLRQTMRLFPVLELELSQWSEYQAASDRLLSVWSDKEIRDVPIFTYFYEFPFACQDQHGRATNLFANKFGLDSVFGTELAPSNGLPWATVGASFTVRCSPRQRMCRVTPLT